MAPESPQVKLMRKINALRKKKEQHAANYFRYLRLAEQENRKLLKAHNELTALKGEPDYGFSE